jgi:hypothetical protein
VLSPGTEADGVANAMIEAVLTIVKGYVSSNSRNSAVEHDHNIGVWRQVGSVKIARTVLDSDGWAEM